MRIPDRAERYYEKTRLLVFSEQAQIRHERVSDIVERFATGDVLVVNRSATLPSSFTARLGTRKEDEAFEIRLAAFQGPDPRTPLHWQAIAFGAGDWRQTTETRGAPPVLNRGDILYLGDDPAEETLTARIERVEEGRLLTLAFIAPTDSAALIQAMYRHGKAIQYAYHKAPLQSWDQQTLFSGPPVSVEPPSASFALTWELLLALREKGVHIQTLLHSAGISSTGSEDLDQRLPLPEWYQIPEATVTAIQKAREEGKRVVAWGTTVMRALESATQKGTLEAGEGMAHLQIRPGYRFRVVNALVTGMHEPEASHMHILKALCPLKQLQQGYLEAARKAYRGHEYGDLSLLSCG